MLVAGRLVVLPAVLVFGKEILGVRTDAEFLPAVVDLHDIHADLRERRNFSHHEFLAGELVTHRIGGAPGVGKDEHVALWKYRIARGVEALERLLHAVVTALI